jgi:hypothetical protein
VTVAELTFGEGVVVGEVEDELDEESSAMIKARMQVIICAMQRRRYAS